MRLLCPKPAVEGGGLQSSGSDSQSDAEMMSNHILCLQQTSSLWNEAFREHSALYPQCLGYLEWDCDAEIQRGLGWEERLKCLSCSYVSPRRQLYRECDVETKKGRRAVAINRSVIVGLSHSGIGYDGLKNILITMNIPPPSHTCLQRSANIVGEKLIEVNQQDMSDTRHKINQLAKRVGKTSISVEGDCRYNNPLQSTGGKTLFQPATQATYSMCENLTKEKKIISVTNPNKLCRTASVLRGQGLDVTCPRHQGVCTANISKDQVIGDEKKWASQCLSEMAKDREPLAFSSFTTDGDSRAFQALSEHHTDAELFRDPFHLSRGQRRLNNNTKFSKGFFQNIPKGQSAEKMQRRLGNEIPYRCSAELNHMIEDSEMNAEKIAHISTNVKNAVLHCTLGNHAHCKKHSYVCTGKTRGCWPRKFLPEAVRLNANNHDFDQLKKIVDYRLSQSAVMSTRQNKHTQKCEAVNRAYTRCNPKHITFSRNFPGRIHAAAHLVNNGLVNSTMKKCDAVNAPLLHGSKVVKRLVADTKSIKCRREATKSEKYRKSRATSRKLNYEMYDVSKAKIAVSYEKHHFDNVREESRKKGEKLSHSSIKHK